MATKTRDAKSPLNFCPWACLVCLVYRPQEAEVRGGASYWFQPGVAIAFASSHAAFASRFVCLQAVVHLHVDSYWAGSNYSAAEDSPWADWPAQYYFWPAGSPWVAHCWAASD